VTNFRHKLQKPFSFWGTSSPDPLPGLCPWTPLGDLPSPRPPVFLLPRPLQNPPTWKSLASPLFTIRRQSINWHFAVYISKLWTDFNEIIFEELNVAKKPIDFILVVILNWIRGSLIQIRTWIQIFLLILHEDFSSSVKVQPEMLSKKRHFCSG